MSARTFQLSDYQILDSLGSGGNAKVFRAKKDGCEFALKQLKKGSSLLFEKKKKRFIDETQSVIKVQNDIQGILPIIDYALPDAKNNYWYTMPVATPILKKVAELSLDEKTQAIIELTDTMALLHARGIVHRDIKPSNLYFHNDHYCLGDFGLVDYPDKVDVTRDRETVGPKFSIAPEMKRDAKTADGKKADVYSLAKTLWMLLADNNTGFEGIYIADDRLIGLRFHEEFRTEHLVELESLLADATKEDPASRPSMNDFSQRLKEWLTIKNDWEQSCLSQWRFVSQKLFNGTPPSSANCNERQTIVDVLNLIGRMRNFNHMFFPSGGGLDFIGAKLAEENNCICLETDPREFLILKPTRLIAETFSRGVIWNYFRLELETVNPLVEQDRPGKTEEFITEDTPGHYISWKCGNYGYYEDGSPLPKGYRLVRRYLSGNFVFFCKTSIYNYIHGTYDARHNTMNATEFRKYIESLRQKFSQFCTHFRVQDTSELYHPFANYIGETEQQQKKQANDEHTNAIIAAAKLTSDFEDWVENNLGSFDFSTLCKQQTNSSSKLAYYIEFSINRTIDVLELSSPSDNKRFLYRNGKIYNEKNAKELNLEKYVLYSAESAKKLISDCLLYIVKQYEDQKKICINCDTFDFFEINVLRIAPPSHLFTKAEIERVMREADDSISNVLVIDGDGFARVIPSTADCFLYPVRHETWCEYNNYVGKYSQLNTLDDDYRGSLEGWLNHLKTGKNCYIDYVLRNKTEDSLIAAIRRFYL